MFVLKIRHTPVSKRTYTPFPYTTLFRTRAEELIVNAIGRDARERQGGNRVAQEGPRPADIVVAVCDRGVGDQPFVGDDPGPVVVAARSEEHTSELQSLMRSSYAVLCLKKKNTNRIL